ncbi:tRNA (cytosine(34)-C(5))-methyltransferase, mitochondrial isoform X2 [Brienomyrus brachyistius]|uniref:tRNA (cytosine(34)-C(5))-methyltransferase, mitochondrial isoform X2 n=1 Tax=Brienomyrus brachyistius TaxID=42636 RepID=UPI0020B36074|nr:tRNA (cytosine(34)-C(5))-methyltransferase, mitochondrial isoform X2 [Brienomyrus brachyistius]
MVRDVLILFGIRARNLRWERGKYQMFEALGCHSCFKSQCASWRVHVSERLFTSSCHQLSAGPQKQVCEVVLQHFDQQYSLELGQLWVVAREVLLQPHCWQYGIMLNRFSAPEDLKQRLCLQGFSSLVDHGSLQCLVHPARTRFPSQKHQPGWLKQYYLLNTASLLPVLALDVREGDRLLDMCSAPGGKALAVLQCATPALLHCNELNFQRQQWLSKTLESYVPPAVRNILTVSNLDGRTFGKIHAGTFDKVLVDAPCSNDRSWLYSAHPQQSTVRLGERTRLPEIQRDLLRSALAAVRPGGLVVYSTCTLSHAENGAVVQEVLSCCSNAELQNLEEMSCSLSHRFTFGPSSPFGLLVVPDHGRTWGPMFLSKLKRLY